MTVNINKITDYITAAELWVDFDLPADLTGITIDANGVPAGARARNLGGVQGEVSQQYTPTIATVDIEQAFSGIAPHVTQDAMSIRATLVEPNAENIELVASQGTRWNYLKNGSFEGPAVAGIAPGWQSVGVITAPSVTGTGVQPAYGLQAQVFTTGAAAGGLQTPKVFHPQLVAGKIVVLSAYGKAGTTPNLTLKIEAFDAAGASLGTNTATQALTAAYARGSVAYTLPALTATVQFTLQDATGQTATWTLDNAQVEIVASGSTPTTVVGPRMLSVGGRLDTRVFPVAVIGRKPGTSKFTAFVVWQAYVTGGLNIRKQKGNPTAFQVEFAGTPVPSFSAGNQYGVYQEQP